jgi:maltose alpha-D-glucosyltransferase/alpha-amylase
MLRSLSYAAAAALEDIAVEQPEARKLLAPQLHHWEQAAAAAFVDAYRVSAAGCPSLPAAAGHAGGLIDLFTLEKALYELRYEVDNRPEWIAIPLMGLLRLIDGEQEAL